MAGQAQFRSDTLEADIMQPAEQDVKDAPKESAEMIPAAPAPRPTETFRKNHKFVTEKLRSYQSDYILFGTPNILHDRFEIDLTKEIPAFSKKYVKAYYALDKTLPAKPCIAYLTEPYHAYRNAALSALTGIQHTNLIELLDSGRVYFPALQANRFVIIYRQPEGESLQSMLEKGEFFKTGDVMRQLIIPITSLLQRMHAQGTHHGSLCPANIFVTEQGIVAGDCLAEPAGTIMPYIYDPLEHLLAIPEGKGAGSILKDMYALAILVLDCCNELGNRKQLTREQLAGFYLTRGTYTTLVNESTLPDFLIDFCRGILLEKASDRWTIEQLVQYASGKRFNLIPPGYPRDCSRSHQFAGTDHYTLAHLAYNYHQHWDNVLNDLKDKKVLKWLDSLNFKSHIKERLEKVQMRAGRVASKGSAADELIARAIMTLDSQGPIRLKNISVHADHLPHFLSIITQKGDLHAQLFFQEIINNDLAIFWQEGDGVNYRKLDWDPAVVRQLHVLKSIGFGMERVLYELNPVMPCMSRDYLPYYATNAKTMLLVLDALAPQSMDKTLVDRHLIAFIAARSGIRKEVKLSEYKNYPELYHSKEFQALVILARAQEKTKIASLPGLCGWAGLRVIEIIEHFKSNEIRNSFSRDLQTVLPRGKLAYIVHIMQNKDYLTKDYAGFIKASQAYHKNLIKITRLRDKKAIWNRAEKNGLKTAFLISLAILFGVSYFLMAKYAL